MKINRDVPPPFAIQLEPVEGCSLACSFCGLQSIRDNGADADLGIHGKNSAPYKFMSLETVNKIAADARDLGWTPRFEYAMHGEPSMHPRIAEMVQAVRSYNKKWYLMMTSNGSGLLKDSLAKIEALFDAGLNTLALDDYAHSGGWVPSIVKKITDHYSDPLSSLPYEYRHYPADPRGNPHKRHTGRKLVVINDISENTTGNHQLTNQGGASFSAKKESLVEKCAKPFRELSIRWDGNVSICCDDWRGEYKIGNVNDTPLDEIWYHPRFEAARRRLYAADRSFGACTGCDVRTMRNGLLPDKYGKGEMLAPDAESNALVREALRGKVFSIKIAA